MHPHPFNSPLHALIVVAFSALLAACQTTQPAGSAVGQAKPDCKPVIWQNEYYPAEVASGKGQFSIAFCPKAHYKKETTWQYKKKGGSWSSAQVVPPANKPETVTLAAGGYIVRINPPKGCDTPEPEHIEIMDGWHLPVRVSDMSGGHCPGEDHGHKAAKAPVGKDGEAGTKATGVIIVVPTPINQSTDPALYGRLRVKYLAAADQAYSTTYQISDNGGGSYSNPQPVLPYNTTSSVPKLINTYKVKINAPLPHSAGPPKDAPVVEDKVRVVNIDY